MNEIEINGQTYRIRKMNAIEVLALQSQVDFENFETTKNCYYTLLEMLEVNAIDKWLPVKTPKQDIFYPANIENDITAIQTLIKFVLDYLKEGFQKSNESNSKTE